MRQGMRFLPALAVLGLAACAAEPPPPPPAPPERVSVQPRRRPPARPRNVVPAAPAPAAPQEAPATPSPPPEETAAARPAPPPEAPSRQERDRRAFVVCSERSDGQGLEILAACLRSYGSTGVIPTD